jgi:hypothetical protein
MAKRPSLFSTPGPRDSSDSVQAADNASTTSRAALGVSDGRPPSRTGKRVLSIYLDPLAWKQLRQLALDSETTTQALGEEAVNLLFAKHGLNRSA